MTVAQQTALYAYTGDSVTTDFPFPSKILSAGDILVGVGGVLQTSGYSVLNVGVNEGGTVRFAAAPAAVRVVLLRKPPISQLVDFVNGQSTLDDTVENALDKLTMICQYLGFVLGRSVRLDDFDADDGSGLTLPPRAERVGKSLGFDSAGDLIATITSLTQSQVDAIFAAAADAVDAAAAAQLAKAVAESAAGANLHAADSVAAAQATTIPGPVNYIRTAGFAAAGDGGGGLAARRITEPAHPFKFSSNGGAVWWEFEQPFRPEMIGHFPGDAGADLAALVAQLAAVLPDASLYLGDGDWYASALFDATSVKITGPGAERVRYILMGQPVGDAWRQQARFDSGADMLREQKSASARSQHTAFTSVSAAGVVADTTYTAAVLSLEQDGMGAFQSALNGAFWPRPGRYRLRGAVIWQASDSGARIVSLAKNGSTSAEIVQQRNAGAVTGVATTQEFDFEVSIAAQGEYLSILLWHSAGSNLSYTLTASLEALYQQPIVAVGQRVGLCAGPWADVLTAYGSVESLAQHMAAYYDSYVFCNVLASNSGNGVWPDTPTKTWYNCVGAWANNTVYYAGYRVHDVVADRMVICLIDHTSPMTGTFAEAWAATPSLWRVADQPLDFPYVASAPWLEFGKLVRLIKAIRPEFEVLLYISASLDAPYTNSIGAPWAPYDGARGFFNVVHFMDRYDRLFPEADGYFFDFFNASCLTAVARDQVVQLAKQRNKKVVCNTVAISAEALRFIAECPFIGRGDGVLNEGFEYDAGSSVSTATDAFLLEMTKHRARGIRSFAFIEETTAAEILPGSAKRAVAKLKFDLNYVPGDCFGHSWASYTTVV